MTNREKMRRVCKNCGEFFAFHGAGHPHNCPITESHTEQTNFAPKKKGAENEEGLSP